MQQAHPIVGGQEASVQTGFQRWTLGLLALLLLLIPFHEVIVRVVPGTGGWDDAVLLLLAAALLPLLAARSEARGRFFRLWTPALVLAAVSLLSAGINRVPAPEAAAGLRGMLPYLVSGMAASLLAGRGTVERLLRLLVGVGTATAVYGILSFVTFKAVGGPFDFPAAPRNAWESFVLYPYYCGAYPVPDGWRLVSTFMNDNYFGVWMAMLAPLAVALGLNADRLPERRLAFLAALLMLVAFTWTYSRSAIAALAAAVVVLAWRVSRKSLLLALPVLLAAPLYTLPADENRFTNLQGTEGGRIYSIRRTLEVLRTQPLLGRGPGTRGLADMNYAKVGYETGLLGLAAFGWLLLSVCLPALRVPALDPAGRRLAGALLAALAAMMAAAIGGEVWEIPQLAHTFWILAGLLGALQATGAPTGRTVDAPA